MKARIFDHLTGDEPEDKRFSKVAHKMHGEPWWSVVPSPADQDTVSGEIRCKEPRR